MKTLRSRMDDLRKVVDPEPPVRLCLHWEPGVCPKGTCGPNTPKIKLRWPEDTHE
jgi:hypothetical protein